MSVMEVSADAESRQACEITIDMRRLREWSTLVGCAQAAAELARARDALATQGVRERSAARIVSAVGRYAFLTQEGCLTSRRALWRMHAVDEVPPDALARLTWQQVRPRLREIAVPREGSTRYFHLSGETCRLLMLMRVGPRQWADSSHVFPSQSGEPWDPACLAQALTMISVR